jgi:putative glutamine amidotransferase
MRAPRVGLSIGRLQGEDGRLLDAISHEYSLAVAVAGGLPMLLPELEGRLSAQLVAGVDALVLTGGGDVGPGLYGQDRQPETAGVDPVRDASELALVDAALAQGLPVLAICRGAQLLNVALGGALHQHLADHGGLAHDDWDRRTETVHEVTVVPSTLLAAVTGLDVIKVNSVHHQGLDRLGAGLEAVGFAQDGLVEAAEDRQRRLLAVQWHPELIVGQPGNQELFGWVVAQAASSMS